MFSWAEIAKHSDDTSCWIVIHGKVHDLTEFLEEHPGGKDILLGLAGKDGSQCFDDIGHSDEAKALCKRYCIGTLQEIPFNWVGKTKFGYYCAAQFRHDCNGGSRDPKIILSWYLTTVMATKVYTYAEIKEDSEKDNSTLIVIHDGVYNVTEFLNEHPGGEEVLLEQLGKDATEAFEDVGHSTDARDMMKKYKVGELAETERSKKEEKKQTTIPKTDSGDGDSSWKSWLLPIAIGLLATVAYRFFFLSQ